MKPNGPNERLKRAYTRYLRDARRKSESSIDAALAAIDRFEAFTKRRPFLGFHIEQASEFKDHLAEQLRARTKKPLSLATQLHILAALRAFFIWLADQPRYRRRIRHSDSDYFSLSLKQTATARANNEVAGPTLEQVRHVVRCMPAGSDVEKRNRALFALAILTGARDDALASLLLKHIDVADRMVRQDPREVRTKASKMIDTWFFPVGEDFVEIVEEWVTFLKIERQWGLGDPLFPKTKVVSSADRRFQAAGLARACWSNATPIRAIFRNAFAAAGLPYFNPHSLRNTLARIGLQRCPMGEQFQAWSQNFGHEKMLTTFTSYGKLDRLQQRDIVKSLWQSGADTRSDLEALLRTLLLRGMPVG
jgi:integrase/recombinase XerD